MTDYIHLLNRQLAEHLKDADLSDSALKNFLNAVNESYQKFEFDHRTLEHSLTLSAEELVTANEEMHAVFQAIPDQLIHIDSDGVVITYKSGSSSHHYLTTNRLINKSIHDITNKGIATKFENAIEEVNNSIAPALFEFVMQHEDIEYSYEARILPVKNKQVIALIRDITERKQAEEQIAYLAYHDNLTGLPNTRLFKDRLEQGIIHAERNKNKLAILFLDLDRFKLINDTMGHGVGDKLLQSTSDRLQECIRETDSVSTLATQPFGSSVARMGGDEFTIMLENVEGPQSVRRICKRITSLVNQPLNLDGQDVYTSTSIGIALYPNDGTSVDALLKNADAAMYHAKEQGRNNFQFYTESMNQMSSERMELENNLHKAIENNELMLYYQPQVDVATKQVIGMEALIRWKHPKKGFISPVVFIPLAEETGMIIEIGEWVIREACKQGAAWIKAGYQPVKISVNLSAKQLKEEKLNIIITKILLETGMPVKYLGIELTESAIILDPGVALSKLNKIKSLGIELSLDDFGTGYSSLSYLKRFPIDTLKIDQAFIRDIKIDQDASSLVKAIIAMAHSMGMNVVAEGVEHQEQLEFLAANDCDIIQGFYFSKPAPAADLEDILKNNNHLT